SAAEYMDAGLGRAPAAAGAGAAVRRQHLLSRAQDAGLYRNTPPAGCRGGAAALGGRRAAAGPQPGVVVRLRRVRCRYRPARTVADGERRRRSPRRHRLRVRPLSNRPPPAPPAAADAVSAAGAVGLSPAARKRANGERRLVWSVRRGASPVVHVLRSVP